jgi:hypothetical protein
MTQTQLVNEICSKFFATQISCGDSCVCEKLKGNLEAELPGIVSEMEEVLLNRGIVDYHSMLAACYTATLVVARMKERQEQSSGELVFDEKRHKNRFFDSSEKYDTWADIPQKKPITGPEGYEDGFLEQPPSTMPEGD